MTITLTISPELEAELVRQAAAHGSAFETYVTALLEEAVHLDSAPTQQELPPPEGRVEAIEQLMTFGKTHGLSLGRMTIRELRHEARP
jgi:hypothetical protein